MKRAATFAFAVAGAMTLSACSKMNMRPTMEADAPETGIEGLIFVNELSKAYVSGQANPTFCERTLPSYQESGKHSYRRFDEKDATGKVTKRTEKIFACMTFRPVGNDAEGKAIVLNHLRAGFALSDLYCKNFFRRIASHSQQRGFARNNVNDVGAAISAILGLTSTTPAVAGGVGAGFGLADSVFRTYDQQFLISPDLGAVQSRVFSEQASFARNTYTTPPDNLFDASIAISDHANFCSYIGMKRLIGAALGQETERKNLVIEETMARFIASAKTVTDAVAAEKARREAEASQPPTPTPSPTATPTPAPGGEPEQEAP